jgi:uncharacterized protein (TIGR04255 family)
MATPITPLPVYEKPPINEVVCGILFDRIDKLLSPYLGMLWERYKPEYPKCQEAAPLAPTIENFDQSLDEAQYINILPIPRTWFVHVDESKIIQIQRDRFHHNWRKIQPDDQYPRYETIINDFKNHLLKFTEFLEENDLGILTPLQYELTYINSILQGEEWETLNDIDKIFPNFSWQKGKNNFLTSPETINWQTTFVLPEHTGRLHAKVQSAIRRGDRRSAIQFELTVRGMGKYKTPDTMLSWFELAHDWIVRGFTDLTALQVQKDIWGRVL